MIRRDEYVFGDNASCLCVSVICFCSIAEFYFRRKNLALIAEKQRLWDTKALSFETRATDYFNMKQDLIMYTLFLALWPILLCTSLILKPANEWAVEAISLFGLILSIISYRLLSMVRKDAKYSEKSENT